MKVVISGSRDLRVRESVTELLDIIHGDEKQITELITGMALHWLWDTDPEIGGPDRYGFDWAVQHPEVSIIDCRADWKTGKGAGMRRNADMADYADIGCVWWDGTSTGTADMIEQMKKRGKKMILTYPNIFEFE